MTQSNADTADADADAADAAQPSPGGRSGLRGHPWLTLITLSVGAMMVSLDGTIVTVAQPAMQERLHASLAQVQWVTNGYLLAVAALLITAGKLGDRFGHRTVFLIGAAGFTLSSAAIGASPDIGWVIAFRVLQGVFGALMQPATLGLLRTAFPGEKINMPIAVRSGVIAASTAAGPIVGGLLVEHVGWQWVFFLNLPVGALAIVAGLLVLRDVRVHDPARSGAFDVPGVVLLSASLCSLIWGLTKASGYGWGDLRTVGCIGGALGLGAVFVWWQGRAADPLVPLRIFRSVQLSAGVVLMTVMAFVMVGSPFVLVFYLQNVLGLSPAQCGVRVLGLTLLMIVGAPLAGMWMHRAGARVPVVSGMLAIAAAMVALSQLDAHAGTVLTSLCFFLLGLGFSPVMVAATKLVIGSAPVELSGVAGGLQQTSMQVGGSLGTAVLGTVIGAHTGSVLPGRLADAAVPDMPPAWYESTVEAVSVGLAPDLPVSGRVAAALRGIAEQTFLEGMERALLVAAGVAFLGALTGLLVKGKPRA
ncbi:DHA2 family efflux MFS transporter permease subunit [Streptomyces griseocarneus]|uniref:DHA2 family efflux MFS transporter permease subunit n=1 Tax=Streptomyces griseocarneus TaxID=51201 RepID=UPI00167C9B52|nr:DHA2 family efflux MFS transporter permease subunit [Streptomyces griseocarneus]MBZ6476785.1 DHA2 family efflux MFS transporter permease subunit [Streptomyces griseocarneus]GHG81465.1 MFS transporter [Streptomyces griseocarneus]